MPSIPAYPPLRDASIGLGLLVSLITTAPCLAAELTPQQLFRQASAQLVAVELTDEKEAVLSTHSAVAIGGNRFATTCEVLSGVAGIFLVESSGRHAASLVQHDPRRNLCVLASAGLDRDQAIMRDSPPQPGERIYALSNALGLGLGISEGVVSGMRRFAGETYIQFTAPIAPGSEGGGLFDSSGQLIGLIDYQRRDGQNINFAAPARWIAEIGTRQTTDDKRTALRDKANTLSRQQQWPALLEHAAGWTAAYPDDAEAWLWQAAMAESLGDMAKAEHGYREVRRLETDSLKGGLGLARVLLQQKKNEAARTQARSLLALRQEDAEIWFMIGRTEAVLGNLAAAEEAFRRTIGLSPWATVAYENLAWVAGQRGDVDTQVSIWRQLAHLQPDAAKVSERLAAAYLLQKRPARALATAERLLQKAPDNADAWYWKGVALVGLERPMAAIEAFLRSLAGQPRSPAWVWSTLGDTYYGLQMWRESVAAHRQSLRLEPNETQWRRKLGIALKDSYEFEEAMSIFKDITKTQPNDPFGWRQVGFVHAYRNEIPESIVALEHTLNLDPKQGKVWLALTEQYYKAGRRENMLRAYKQLRALDQGQAEQAYLWFVLPAEIMP
ncbi:MAG: tetratricopeptide repeat protein [Azonexus sp.]|nr:tetratricopeptide repeat protein [Azonexus sp.]